MASTVRSFWFLIRDDGDQIYGCSLGPAVGGPKDPGLTTQKVLQTTKEPSRLAMSCPGAVMFPSEPLLALRGPGPSESDGRTEVSTCFLRMVELGPKDILRMVLDP